MRRLARLFGFGIAAATLCGHHLCNHVAAPPLAMPAAIPQDGQTFQRDGATGDVVISVPVTPSSRGAKARAGTGAWQLLDTNLFDGLASGVVRGVPVGRHNVEVRRQNNELLWQAGDVGVGDVYVLWGQSNMIMQGETIRESMSGARVLPIRVATGAPSPFKPARDSLWYPEPYATHVGSVWPLVADAITSSTGIPVAFVAAAEGSTRLAVDPNWNVGGFFWNRMIQNTAVATGATLRVRAVLGHQGEGDASRGVSYAVYKDALCAFGAALAATLAGAPAFVVSQLGASPLIPEVQLQIVRDAQRDAALECPGLAPGPVTADLPVGYSGHFGDAAIPELAARWCEALAPLYADAVAPACGLGD